MIDESFSDIEFINSPCDRINSVPYWYSGLLSPIISSSIEQVLLGNMTTVSQNIIQTSSEWLVTIS